MAGLTYRYGAVTVLRGIDLTVPSGSVTALLGPNAAGKTTLLRILATLLRPAAGQVLVAGHDGVTQPHRVRATVGLVAHQPLLYPDLTAEENLRLYGRLYGVAGLEARLGAVLGEAGLWGRRRDPVRTLSRGLQQRLAIARATLHEPTVLLLDEPHTGLDPAAAEALDGTLRDLAAAGRTVIVTSHDLARAHALADDLVVLSRGRVAWSGAAATLGPLELAARYRELVDPAASRVARASAAAGPVAAAAAAPDAPDAEATAISVAPRTRPRDRRGGLGAALAAVLWKDLVVELRSREVVPPVVVFGLVVLVLFHFTVATEPSLEALVAPGALWVALAFGSMLGLARLMAGDVDSGCVAGLLASPADRGGLFLGKFLAGYVFSLVVAVVLLPAFAVLLNLPLGAVVPLAGVVALGLVGWQAAGTLMGAMAVSARAREVLLPVLLLPVVMPLLVAATQAASGVLADRAWTEVLPSLALMASYGVIFVVLGFLLYPLVLESSA